MVDVHEHHLVGVREQQLVFGQSSAEAKTDVSKGLEDVKMESSASTGTDVAVITVASLVRGVQANEELGKKLVVPPYQHLSSPSRNYSQRSEQEDKIQRGEEKVFSEAGAAEYWLHPPPPPPAKSGPAAMETDYEDNKAAPAAEAFQGMDIETTTETTEDEAYQSRKEVPRCDSENLDSSPDYGRREASQGNSRHICKHCAKEFSSGRALGGHMRAHGSLSVEEVFDGVMEKEKQQQHQLSGSMGHHHASHDVNNTDSGSDPPLPMSVVKQEGGLPPAYSKRSRSNGKEIHSGRSAAGGRRSKHGSGGSGNKQRGEVPPKNSGEEIDNVGQEDEEKAAVPMTEPEPSISSDDDGNNEGANDNEEGVTDGTVANNVCNVCDLEFDNSKQLNSHKKSHYLYGLRRNPKRSRRFMDQDFTAEAAAASLAPAKKTSSMFTSDGNMHECSECKKRFQSWKALFGHMRCHPDRPWRGIRPPTGDLPPKDKQQQQQGTSSVDRQLTGSRRKDTIHLPDAASQESDSGSEAEGRGAPEHAHHGKAAAASAAVAASDNESDTESIEAAYMHNVERQPSSSSYNPWISAARSTKQRTKRSRHSVRSLQAVIKTAAVPLVNPAANEMEHETAMGLMMLASKEGGKEFWLGNRTNGSEIVRQSILENALSETERDDFDDQLDNENASDSEYEEFTHKEDLLQNSKGKGKLDSMDNVSLCEENEEGGDDCDAGEQGIGSTKPKYVCNTCERVFKSHQALGGHRASHKKVKGCFARTNVSDGVQDSPDEEMISEEIRSDEQLPTDLQEQSQSEGDDKERQFSAFSKEDSGEIMNGNRNKSKGHVCTICGRVFNSGQALGGHKRCHYNTKEATSSEATSSTNNTTKPPPTGATGGQCKFYKDELVQQGGPARLEETVHMQPEKFLSEEFSKPAAAQVRPVKEKFLDLNLPAPVNDDDMDLEAYEMPPANLMCSPQPKKIDLKGAADFPSTIGLVKSGNAELETGKTKDGYFPLYHTASYPSLVEENNQDLDGSQDTGFRSDEVDFSLRYVQCNICDRQFSAVEALSNHEKTHASMMSSVSGLTPISA